MSDKIRPPADGPHFSQQGIPLTAYAWLMIAHHEAGHAVVGILLCYPLRKVCLKPRPGVTWKGSKQKMDLSPLRPIVTLAGAVATKRYDPIFLSEVGLHPDYEEFARLVPNEEEQHRYMAATHFFIGAHWSLVEAVAWRLFEENELSGDQVREIMKTATSQNR